MGHLVEQASASIMRSKCWAVFAWQFLLLAASFAVTLDTRPHSAVGKPFHPSKERLEPVLVSKGKSLSSSEFIGVNQKRNQLLPYMPAQVFQHLGQGQGELSISTSRQRSNLPVSVNPTFNHISFMMPLYRKTALYILRAEYFSL